MLFITGTSTGVGKTATGRAILSAAVSRGINAVPFKPVETGCVRTQEGLLAPSDTLSLCAAAGLVPDSDIPLDLVCPYRLEHPLSPHLAASMSGVSIDPDRIFQNFLKLRDGYDMIVAEGAGGLLVPLSDTCFMADLVQTMALPVIIAAKDELGAINHTLLTIEVLRRRGLMVAGVVFIKSQGDADPDNDKWGNAHAVSLHGAVEVLGKIPWIEKMTDAGLLDYGCTILDSLEQA